MWLPIVAATLSSPISRGESCREDPSAVKEVAYSTHARRVRVFCDFVRGRSTPSSLGFSPVLAVERSLYSSEVSVAILVLLACVSILYPQFE